MAKNILIFSDGTGQGGGVILDERRSNVYKFYRATRSAPDTRVSPDQQIAFYDPGLGSSRGNEHIRFGLWRKIYNIFSQATGLGITRNIVDCYAFLVQHWQPGDRVYLYGFSRGAYTARCVGGVMAYCGIPVKENGVPIKRDARTARRIAEEATVKVYQHGAGRKQARFARQRKELASQFREKYASNEIMNGESQDRANVVPYFIGVWDTVAALGAGKARMLAFGLVVAVIVWCVYALALVLIGNFTACEIAVFSDATKLVIATAVIVLVAYAVTHLRCVSGLSDPWWKTLHRRAWKMKFYDTCLNPRVQYAKHALSIDENRADFAPVVWTESDTDSTEKDKQWFEQIWFAGVHSDIGGSYPETESRLSDIALKWMLDCSLAAQHPVLVDQHYLRAYTDASGRQHDERKSSVIPWKFGLREVADNAALHSSVIERFQADAVVHYDVLKPYRPQSLTRHQQVRHFY